MTTFVCDYAGLKTVAADFLKSIESANPESLEAGFKCFSLHYLGCEFSAPHEEAGAIALMRIVGRASIDAEINIRRLNDEKPREEKPMPYRAPFIPLQSDVKPYNSFVPRPFPL